MTESLKIICLETENFQKIKAVKVNPDGSLVVVGGRNGQGKTSVLDSIMVALGGGAVTPSKPIREGQDEAVITLDLGEYIVTRTFREGKNSLEIKNKDGSKFSSPQKMLDKMVGSLSFDPLSFSKMRPKDQAETLMDFSGFDFVTNAKSRKEAYDLRTDENRMANQAEPIFHPDEPKDKTPVDTAALYTNIKEALQHNETIAKLEAEAKGLRIEAKDKTAAWEAMMKEVDDLEDRAKAIEDRRSNMTKMEVIQMEEKLQGAEKQNKSIKDWGQYQGDLVSMADHKKASDKYTQVIDGLDKDRMKAIANSKIPVDGLSFSSDGISIHGIPFDQCSSAEKLLTSVAIGFAMNPKIKIVLLKEASFLDKESMAKVAKMAEEAGGQVWAEVVGKNDDMTVIIEDGSVVGAPEAVKI